MQNHVVMGIHAYSLFCYPFQDHYSVTYSRQYYSQLLLLLVSSLRPAAGPRDFRDHAPSKEKAPYFKAGPMRRSLQCSFMRIHRTLH